MSNGVLDFGASSDHDWQWMTASKYRYEQAYAATFDQPGKFLAFTGYEWSGDNYRRRRFGDRTIVFPTPYGTIFRSPIRRATPRRNCMPSSNPSAQSTGRITSERPSRPWIGPRTIRRLAGDRDRVRGQACTRPTTVPTRCLCGRQTTGRQDVHSGRTGCRPSLRVGRQQRFPQRHQRLLRKGCSGSTPVR